ncbi:MAG: hypothetical protein QHH10_08300 [Peptococcaceae bacterium]|jgi:phage baseplate assembly protein W|nr:hypothetical protein [Peptococcaceae bacterium]MDH7525295.1 hypothetical protein [Peptococcaceae bacterium]
MEYIIDSNAPLAWDAKGNNRILQNVANLIKTFQYEVAYNRLMGINPDILDKPLEEVFVLYTAEVYRVVSTFEPRAKVKNVMLVGIDQEGNITARVVVEI